MNISEAIVKRRSIRKYKNTPVDMDIILKLIELASWAPSSGNIQNWNFIIVRDPEKKKKIAEYSNQYWIDSAPVLIVVCSDTKSVEKRYGNRGKMYAIQNVAAAIQNLMLSALEFGLGTCWVGYFDENKIKELLEIPEDIEIHAIITLGYPDEEPVSHRKALYQIIHFEKWGNKKYVPDLYPIQETIERITKELSEFVKKIKK